MNRKSMNRSKGFTLIELLVVVLILGILVALALPSYLSSLKTSRTNTANANAKAILTAVQSNYVKAGGTSYTAVATSDITSDMGGAIPTNPCTGAASLTTDYGYTATATTASTKAAAGSNCNATQTFNVSGA